MSFSQLIGKYNIKKQDFFHYLPVRDKRDATILDHQNISSAEKQLFTPQLSNSMSSFYSLLKEYGVVSTSPLKETWERELGNLYHA